jgi:AcrR family transcriptional regulator
MSDRSARPTPPTRSARATQIVDSARALLEAEGPDALTMRRIADVVDIRAPSIYKHLPGKHALEVALVEQGLFEMGDVLHRAVDEAGPGEAIESLLASYRAEALAHPNLYRLATVGPLARPELTPGLEDWAGEPFFLVAGDEFVAQALWSFAHGMVVLELDRRFPDTSELGRTWAAGAAAFAAAVAPSMS